MSSLRFEIYPVVEGANVEFVIGTSLHNKARISNWFDPRCNEDVLEFIQDSMRYMVSAELDFENLGEEEFLSFDELCKMFVDKHYNKLTKKKSKKCQ